MFRALRLALLGLALTASCRIELGRPGGEHETTETNNGAPAGELWVYTSLYRHVVDDLDRLAKEKLPAVEIEWFASGSEKVAARVDAELAAGGIRADVLLTSDPFYFARMKREGQLSAYVPPAALRVPRELVDLDGTWITSRAATMVIVYNTRLLDAERAPKSYADFERQDLKGKIIFGDPLASGTFFTTLAFLEAKFGWPYFDRLQANGLISTGGNSTVIDRVSAGEFAAGLVLLENVLTAKRKGAPLEYVLPAEGPILIPGPIGIFRGGRNPAAARAFMDLVFSPEGQAVMVRGDMHSPDPRQPPPDGAPAWSEVLAKAMPWSEAFLLDVEKRAPELRATFNERVQR